MKLTFLIYDNDAVVNDFPLGVGYLISVLRGTGFPSEDIHVYNMDIYHYSDEELCTYLNDNEFHIVCIGMIAGYWQYKQFKRMMAAINKLRKRPIVITGGFMFTPEPEYFMKKFKIDYVVLGEGERSFPILIESVANNKSVDDV